MRPIRRLRTDGVSPVVAEILLVAITVVLAAVIYLMASGMLGTHANPAPLVALAGPVPYSGGSYNATLRVVDASRAESMVNYRFNLRIGLEYGSATTFGGSGVAVTIHVNGTAYRVTWTDVDGGGTLTQGDEVIVAGRGASLPAHTGFDFVLVWMDGSQVTHLAWASP